MVNFKAFIPVKQIVNRQKLGLWIVSLAFVLRLLWAIAVPVVPVSDSIAYDILARNLAEGEGYVWDDGNPTAYWPVGTSFIYSLLYQGFGFHYWPIVMLNIAASLVIIMVSMDLARKFFTDRIAYLTGFLLAIWPSQIQYVTVLASELLFTALVLVALVVWLNEGVSLWLRVAIAAPTLAAASYIRPTALLLPILFLVFRFVVTRKYVSTLAAILAVFMLMGLCFAPWAIRNARVLGEPVLIATNSGPNFWMGNNPETTGGYQDPPPEIHGMSEIEQADYLKAIAINYIKEEPGLFILRCFSRLIDTHSRESISIVWNEPGLLQRFWQGILFPLKVLNLLYWLAMLLLALGGIVLLLRTRPFLLAVTHPTVLIWAYYALIHSVTVSQDRYHYPSIPMIAILAATSLDMILSNKEISPSAPSAQ